MRRHAFVASGVTLLSVAAAAFAGDLDGAHPVVDIPQLPQAAALPMAALPGGAPPAAAVSRDQLGPLERFNSGFPLEAKAVWRPEIDEVDRRLWSLSLLAGQAEYGHYRIFDMDGRRVGLSRFFTNGTTERVNGGGQEYGELKQRLARERGIGSLQIGKIQRIHTHGFVRSRRLSEDEVAHYNVYRFSPQDRFSARDFRAYMDRVGLAHADLEEQILYAWPDQPRNIRKKAYLLKGHRSGR